MELVNQALFIYAVFGQSNAILYMKSKSQTIDVWNVCNALGTSWVVSVFRVQGTHSPTPEFPLRRFSGSHIGESNKLTVWCNIPGLERENPEMGCCQGQALFCQRLTLVARAKASFYVKLRLRMKVGSLRK